MRGDVRPPTAPPCERKVPAIRNRSRLLLVVSLLLAVTAAPQFAAPPAALALPDTDGDGFVNALDPDSDNDALFDGTERGNDCSNPATDTSRNRCIADADAGATTTSALNPDTDNGGESDGSEDANRNGQIDAGERDPNNAADDVTDPPAPPAAVNPAPAASTLGLALLGLLLLAVAGRSLAADRG